VSANMEKDVILLCSDNGKVRPKTLKRLKNAMEPKTKDDHLHLTTEILIDRTPPRWGGRYADECAYYILTDSLHNVQDGKAYTSKLKSTIHLFRQYPRIPTSVE
jgi:hypothetical protein